jgi:hypothetical protein
VRSSLLITIRFGLSSRVRGRYNAQFSYPNNSAVPLLLTLRGADVQALDLFAGAPNLQLLRTVAIGSEAADEHGVRRSNNTFVLCVARAVFWPHEAGSAAANEFGRDVLAEETTATGTETESGDPGVRVLRGELFVPKGSKRSFAFPRFACRVRDFFLLLIRGYQGEGGGRGGRRLPPKPK